MIHPSTELRLVSPTVGYGVFATALIPAGTVTYVRDPLEIAVTPQQYTATHGLLRDLVDRYSYRDPNGDRIISWDLGKYVNHCCHANTLSTGFGFEIALRDILPGEEITDDYGLFNMDEVIPLICPKGNCRGVVRKEDFEANWEIWDAQLQIPLSRLRSVEQPLLPYLDAQALCRLNVFLDTGKGYPSVRELLFEGAPASAIATDSSISTNSGMDDEFILDLSSRPDINYSRRS